MEVKNEPVDREYNEEGHPPDDGWSDLPIVKPEALETFEDASFRIKCEFQTDIGQPISKEEVALEVCAVNCKDSENGKEYTSFASEFKNQIPAAHNMSSLHPLLNYSKKTLPVSFSDVEINEINVKNEIIGHRPIVVVINLEKKVFYDRNFVCSICMQLFASFDSLSWHRNVHHTSISSKKHSGEATNLCRQLDHKQNGLYVKFNVTSLQCEKQYQCDECHFKFAVLSKLKTHKLLHTGVKPFKCNLCDYKSALKIYLKTHKLTHTGEKLFDCDQCDYKSILKSRLKIHKLSHTGEKPFKCDLCDYKSTRKIYLKTHKLTHTGEKPFECDQCDYKSSRKKSLKNHKLLHTGEKPFECDVCNYKSLRLVNLNIHKLSHTGVKPFECDQCDYKSTRKADIKKHKPIHTGKKPFKCDFCHYKSSRKESLKNHQLLHTAEKLFECEQCDFKSSKRSALKSHKLSHVISKPLDCQELK